ncbi:MAG: hypothetical protein AB7K09_23115 [Planctomycetota bacterium]
MGHQQPAVGKPCIDEMVTTHRVKGLGRRWIGAIRVRSVEVVERDDEGKPTKTEPKTQFYGNGKSRATKAAAVQDCKDYVRLYCAQSGIDHKNLTRHRE